LASNVRKSIVCLRNTKPTFFVDDGRQLWRLSKMLWEGGRQVKRDGFGMFCWWRVSSGGELRKKTSSDAGHVDQLHLTPLLNSVG
jgi:hypothetical protein